MFRPLSQSSIFSGKISATIVLVFFGVYGFIRYSRYYRRNLWFLNLGLNFVLIPLAVSAVLNLDVPATFFIFCCGVLLWAVGSYRLKDTLSLQHRTTVLWIASSMVSVMVICHAFIFFKVDHVDVFVASGILAILSLVIAALRSQSPIPVYLLLLIIEILGYTLKRNFQLPVRVSVGGAIGAVFILALSLRLKRLPVWDRLAESDKWFNRDFIFRSKYFIVNPLQATAWFSVFQC